MMIVILVTFPACYRRRHSLGFQMDDLQTAALPSTGLQTTILPSVSIQAPSATTRRLISKVQLQKSREGSFSAISDDDDSVFERAVEDRHLQDVGKSSKETVSRRARVSLHPNMNQEEIKQLALRLHRTQGHRQVPDDSLMTDEEQKMLEFSQRVNPEQSSRSGQNKEWLGSAVRRLSVAFKDDDSELGNQSESGSSVQYMQRVRSQPSVLPPIYRHTPRPLSIRQWGLDKPTEAHTPSISEDKWEDLRYCRYLRAPGGMLKELNVGDDEDE